MSQSMELRRIKTAAANRLTRARRKHAAFEIAGWRCKCGEPATCMSVREELLPAPSRSLTNHGWTISSQRVREELTRREPTCRACASRRAHTSRRLLRDPLMMNRRIREDLYGI